METSSRTPAAQEAPTTGTQTPASARQTQRQHPTGLMPYVAAPPTRRLPPAAPVVAESRHPGPGCRTRRAAAAQSSLPGSLRTGCAISNADRVRAAGRGPAKQRRQVRRRAPERHSHSNGDVPSQSHSSRERTPRVTNTTSSTIAVVYSSDPCTSTIAPTRTPPSDRPAPPWPSQVLERDRPHPHHEHQPYREWPTTPDLWEVRIQIRQTQHERARGSPGAGCARSTAQARRPPTPRAASGSAPSSTAPCAVSTHGTICRNAPNSAAVPFGYQSDHGSPSR